MNDRENIIAGIKNTREEINIACEKSGRNRSEVKLLLATKTVSADRIRIAIEAGERLIGENRVQEYSEKFEAIKDLNCERHFIGHLQTNKIKEVLKYVSCIQSVDRIELAEKLDSRLQFEGRSINIFVQINTSFEESKFGIPPEEAFALIKKINNLDTLKIKGLMTIGLFSDDEVLVKKSYHLLREIKDKAIAEGLIAKDCSELSMGMSNDLEWAIAEGATMVRVGSAIFGRRN
ncbi:MAG TPA: YggS family pyridoxal phosphate-dependent enzyme [Arachidicoccus soli]|uniref:Pyridoxal phosphate homeostasis protein n=1 Tax=Arachidicoccus soli TaxID=2341117 RepID=A0A386HKY8_9BACT|nr:YggS family pyridoxal phosphate-dependent enzyme [Arachidicoccus soli]AYD46286.1 YggS family pyridoxal phosphate-dependent enzyme [Arachidicoccus soli]HEU0226164.1 YggS family pyridoxal phosphate-dependent enzyme [Arachidicoccus soli]